MSPIVPTDSGSISSLETSVCDVCGKSITFWGSVWLHTDFPTGVTHLAAPVPTPTPGPQPSPVPTPNNPLVAAINAARTAKGVPALTEDPRLTATASAWAASMAEAGFLSHGDFAGRIVHAIGNVAGGEDAAMGQLNAIACVLAWASDSAHEAILYGDWSHCGGGSAADSAGRLWWTADFARE